MTIAETEVELIEESHVHEDRDPLRHVAPRQTGNHIREIEASSSPDLTLTSTIDRANGVKIAGGDHRDHQLEIRERRYESAIEDESYLIREALISPNVVLNIRHQANVGRVEAHPYLDLIIRSRSEHLHEAHHALTEGPSPLHGEIRDVELIRPTHPEDGRPNVTTQTIVQRAEINIVEILGLLIGGVVLPAQNATEESPLVRLNQTAKDATDHLHPEVQHGNKIHAIDPLSINHHLLIKLGIRTEREISLQTKAVGLQTLIATNHRIALVNLRHVLQKGPNPIEGHLQSAIEGVGHLETNTAQLSRRESREDHHLLLRVPTASK